MEQQGGHARLRQRVSVDPLGVRLALLHPCGAFPSLLSGPPDRLRTRRPSLRHDVLRGTNYFGTVFKLTPPLGLVRMRRAIGR